MTFGVPLIVCLLIVACRYYPSTAQATDYAAAEVGDACHSSVEGLAAGQRGVGMLLGVPAATRALPGSTSCAVGSAAKPREGAKCWKPNCGHQ